MTSEGRPIVTLLGILASLVLQIIGCVTPWWICTNYLYTSTQIGLWYGVVCTHSTCVTASTTASTVEASNTLKLYRGLSTTGIGLCLFALILHAQERRLSSQPSKQLRIVLILSLVASGSFAIGLAGKVGDTYVTTINYVKEHGTPNILEFPYSLFLTAFGGLLAIILCLRFTYMLLYHAPQSSSSNQTGTEYVPQINTPNLTRVVYSAPQHNPPNQAGAGMSHCPQVTVHPLVSQIQQTPGNKTSPKA